MKKKQLPMDEELRRNEAVKIIVYAAAILAAVFVTSYLFGFFTGVWDKFIS